MPSSPVLIYDPKYMEMKNTFCFLALLTSAFVSAQSFEWTAKSAVTPQKEVSVVEQLAYNKAYNERQIGTAGTIAAGLEGQSTTYGETFRSGEMTASHGLLPPGTLLQVINLDNNASTTVRVNDRGQLCANCLVQLSPTAAASIGMRNYGRVSVKRVGFSNWNPTPALAGTAPTAYGSPAPVQPGATGAIRPVSVGGQTTGWQARGVDPAPAAYGGVVATYGQPAPAAAAPESAYATRLSAPAVASREVGPGTNYNQPATYSRRPVAVAAPQPYAQPSAGYQQAVPAQGTSQPSQFQAAPPQPTVQRFQARGGAVVPESYAQPSAQPSSYAAAPATYSAPAAAPTATTARTGYAIQLGAYNNELYAKNRVNELLAAGMDNIFYRSVRKADGQLINRVYAGTFPTMADAQVAAQDIRNDYRIAGIVTRM